MSKKSSTNAELASANLNAADGLYPEQTRELLATAQVYALLAVADAINASTKSTEVTMP